MNLDEYINNLDEGNVEDFISTINSNVTGNKDIDIQRSDTSWIDMVEECIPYLDNIIRNPRRFIVQEENIVPIEKAKVVTEESIKHLAQNTNLIQEVHEDGTVIPLKLLNVYREETMDLYENRFIKSLVDNLYVFVNNKLQESDQLSYANESATMSYSGIIKNKEEDVNISIKYTSSKSAMVDASKDGHSLDERIEHIKEILAAFKSSSFIKSLAESNPVRSPIRKTNVILKEPNFIKALELWEYLEKNNIKPITEKEQRKEELGNNIKNGLDLAFYIVNDTIAHKEYSNKKQNKDIRDIVYDIVVNGNITEAEFKKEISKEFTKANNKKAKVCNNIRKNIDVFIDSYNKRKSKVKGYF